MFRKSFCDVIIINLINSCEKKLLIHDNPLRYKYKRNFSNTIISLQKKSLFTYSYKMSKHSLVDQPAPSNLVLQNQEGELVELKSFIGNGKPSIIFFYPKDETYGCTKEVK